LSEDAHRQTVARFDREQNAMRLVGIESHTDTQPFADLLRDALAYSLFDGGNVGVRRPYLQALFAMPGYDPLAAADNRPQPS
jgi:hypothetical protein